MSWASRRKNRIVISIFGLLCLVGGFLLLPLVTQKPTCFDAKKNGDELGVDCGGGCELQCREFTQDVQVVWQRSFEITPGFYNAVAYIKNQNFASGSTNIPYVFKLYDKDRLLIVERKGETFIEPNRAFVVFEQQIPVGQRTPVYTTFTFEKQIDWYKTDERYNDLILEPVTQNLFLDDIRPRFTATLKNVSIKHPISTIDAYVLLYNEAGNVFQVGKTLIDSISPGAEKSFFIVWQKPFPEPVVRTEIILRYNPFTQKFNNR